MQAPPSVRVTVRASAALPLAASVLWSGAGVALVSWLGLLSPVVSVALAAFVAGLLALRALRRQRATPPAVLAWDGQQWFLQMRPEQPAHVGRLNLRLDFDGWSLIRFDADEPIAQGGHRRWWWATPRTVQGSWSAWRAALLQSQHHRFEDRRGPPAQPVS